MKISFAQTMLISILAVAGLSITANAESIDGVAYRTVSIDGIEVFYREAGNPDRPTVLLLHGFPTSSHMFRDLIPVLSDRYHLVAPDYPGYGYSSMPAVEEFDLSVANCYSSSNR